MENLEIEFLAEEDFIKIIPNFSLNKQYLITQSIGPFDPGVIIEVPLWLAISLKQWQRCQITPPDWLSVGELEQLKTKEQESPYFTEVPDSHYMEISKLLLQHASDNIPKADEIRTLIKDIWDLRIAKLRTSVDKLISSEKVNYAKLNHLTVLELSTVRPLLSAAMKNAQVLKSAPETPLP